MIQIGKALDKDNLEGYVKSLKGMISRARRKPGVAKTVKERKDPFEILLARVQKMPLDDN